MLRNGSLGNWKPSSKEEGNSWYYHHPPRAAKGHGMQTCLKDRSTSVTGSGPD
jgi:hypothetical protein